MCFEVGRLHTVKESIQKSKVGRLHRLPADKNLGVCSEVGRLHFVKVPIQKSKVGRLHHMPADKNLGVMLQSR